MRSLATLALCLCLLAQAYPQSTPPETLHSTSTLVVVPTLVETYSGALIYGLQPSDFLLTDNGIRQTISIENDEHHPLAIVVVMQIGASAPRQFVNYTGIATMLDDLTKNSPHQVAMVTFDSRPEEASEFTPDIEDLKEDLTHPHDGDSGAAILDAVDYGIKLLSKQPAGTRRILLLLSQPHDSGSKAHAQDVVRRLGESNTMICSVTFSPEKTWLKDQFTKPRHENPPYQLGYGQTILHTFDLGTPLAMALGSMRENTAAGIATLSGGESLSFDSKGDFEQQLSLLANHVPNTYALTFQPTSNDPGFHTINVQVLHQPAAVSVKARSSYWSTNAQP